MKRITWLVIGLPLNLLLSVWLLVLGLVGPWVNRHLARRRGAGVGRAVLLLHGYGMGRGSMLVLGNRLARGRRAPVVAFAYGWIFSMERAARKVAAEAARLAAEAGVPVVDVVAHSLGGLVARHARALDDGKSIGRIVTIGTPHRGAWVGHLAVGAMGPEIRRGCDHPLRSGDLSITSRHDGIIPWRRATVDPPADTKILDGWGHAGMLLAQESIDVVAAHLRAEPIAA